MSKRWIIAAGIFGFLGVAAGAFGTHTLRPMLEANGRLDTYETAVQYLLIHALALIGAAWASERFPGRWTRLSGWGFIVGSLLFSGSLFALALFDLRFMGAVAPLGGAGFLAGWLLLVLGVWRWRGQSD
jgi:uncharacterized membrane protein YgdD (TMEM256/DUF423 family)